MQRGRKVPRDVDDYIAGFPDDVRAKLERLRRAIRRAAPAAEETISYRIPAYKLDGYLVYFAAFTKHISVFPRVRNDEQLVRELAAYKGGKGTVQFPLDRPIPLGLVARMVRFRTKENAARAAAKRAAR